MKCRTSAWRWPLPVIATLIFTICLAASQILVWAGAIQGRGGLDSYAHSGIDFTATLTAGRLIHDGKGTQLYDLDLQRAAQDRIVAPYGRHVTTIFLPYNHPPLEALLAALFMGRAYLLLYPLWTLAAALAIGVSLWLLTWALPLPGPARWVMIAAAGSYQPVHFALWQGQNSPFVLLGLCGVYAALRRQREVWGGLALVLVTLKLQLLPVVVLLLLLQRHWKAVAVWASVVAGLGVAAMPVLGLAWPVRYLQFLASIPHWGHGLSELPAIMPTFRGLMVNLLAGWAPDFVTPAYLGLALSALAVFLWTCWRTGKSDSVPVSTTAIYVPEYDLLWALAGIVAVLLPPHLYPYELSVLLLPGWIIAAYALAVWRGRTARFWLALLWIGYAFPVLLYSVMWMALEVVPTVLLLATAAGLLAWRISLGRPQRGECYERQLSTARGVSR